MSCFALENIIKQNNLVSSFYSSSFNVFFFLCSSTSSPYFFYILFSFFQDLIRMLLRGCLHKPRLMIADLVRIQRGETEIALRGGSIGIMTTITVSWIGFGLWKWLNSNLIWIFWESISISYDYSPLVLVIMGRDSQWRYDLQDKLAWNGLALRYGIWKSAKLKIKICNEEYKRIDTEALFQYHFT